MFQINKQECAEKQPFIIFYIETGKHTWIKPDQATFSKLAFNFIILFPHNHPCSLHTFVYIQVALIRLLCYNCVFWWWNHNLTTILTSVSNTQWCPLRLQDATWLKKYYEKYNQTVREGTFNKHVSFCEFQTVLKFT